MVHKCPKVCVFLRRPRKSYTQKPPAGPRLKTFGLQASVTHQGQLPAKLQGALGPCGHSVLGLSASPGRSEPQPASRLPCQLHPHPAPYLPDHLLLCSGGRGTGGCEWEPAQQVRVLCICVLFQKNRGKYTSERNRDDLGESGIDL